MAIPKQKTLTGLLGVLLGSLLAGGLVVVLNVDSWERWFQGLWQSDDRPVQEAAASSLHAPPVSPTKGELALWGRLPARSQVDQVMLGLTQALHNLGVQVQSMQVVANEGKSAKEERQTQGPQVVLSVKALATYAQWVQWWATAQQEGVAWWPEQLSMAPAVGDAQLQIEGQWRVLLSDQEQADGMWAQDVSQWGLVGVSSLRDPFGLKSSAHTVSLAVALEPPKCPKNTLKSPVQGLQLVGLLEGGSGLPGQAVLRAGPCQWVTRVGQRVGGHGHVLHSLGPGASVWLAREDQTGGTRLTLHRKEQP